jgi:hypothetical protein
MLSGIEKRGGNRRKETQYQPLTQENPHFKMSGFPPGVQFVSSKRRFLKTQCLQGILSFGTANRTKSPKIKGGGTWDGGFNLIRSATRCLIWLPPGRCRGVATGWQRHGKPGLAPLRGKPTLAWLGAGQKLKVGDD